MDFEKIETAYTLLLENVQLLQNSLATSFYDALVEQNSLYLEDTAEMTDIRANQQQLRTLNLSREEWRRAYQFLLMKAAQTEPLQPNHQFTPDSIGFIVTFLLDKLVEKESLDVLEIGSGLGNLAETILNHSHKKIDYLGIELDDLLIDISASIADVLKAQVHFVQGDAVRPQVIKESDVIISDLPVGYYPDDRIAQRYEVATSSGHTYAHHLLMEQSLKYLKPNGYAIFLAPNNLLTSEQSGLFKEWLKHRAQIVAMISLPETVFVNPYYAKTLFVLKKQEEAGKQPFVYPLTDLQNEEEIRTFSENFQKWKQGS